MGSIQHPILGHLDTCFGEACVGSETSEGGEFSFVIFAHPSTGVSTEEELYQVHVFLGRWHLTGNVKGQVSISVSSVNPIWILYDEILGQSGYDETGMKGQMFGLALIIDGFGEGL